MSRDLSINVNVNPNGAASPTQTRITQPPESTEIANRTFQNAALAGAIASTARRSLSIGIANIGELTGSRSTQRAVQATNQIATLGLVALKNPIAGIALAVTQATTFAISTGIENRNLEADIRYQQTLRSATHNNSRR
jgi:hypothetical protein